MDWILSNLWIVVAIGGVVLKVLQVAKGATKGGSPQTPPPRRQEYIDAEQVDQTRRIREEIQRKIAERRAGGAIPPVPSQPRLRPEERSAQATPPPSVLELPPVVRKFVDSRSEPPPLPDDSIASGELARQAALAEQLRLVVARRTAAQELEIAEQALAAPTPPLISIEDLRDPAALRRAILMREILGPPVALRN